MLPTEKLLNYEKIIVTGPQRSGTTFAAELISKELNYNYIHESKIKYSNLTMIYNQLLQPDHKCVIHCPSMSAIIHWIDSPKTIAVYMKRNTNHIKKSQEKLNWQFENIERQRYFKETGEIALIKYEAWELFQKSHMRIPYIELEYNSLSVYPEWKKKIKVI